MHTNKRLQRTYARKNGFTFEVNPLILQIVLRIESELVDEHPEFTALSHPARVAEICKQLFFKDVVAVEFQQSPIWVPTASIERDCGGSNVLANSRFELATSISSEERRGVAKVINHKFRRRLKPIVRECLGAFESYNLGLTEINGVDDTGKIRWSVADDRPGGAVNFKRPLN
jgi:hypothetical protein